MTRDVGPGRSIRDRALSAVLDAVGGLLRFSVRRPGTVALTALVVTLAASLFIPRVGLLLDGRSLIPSDRSQQLDSDRAVLDMVHATIAEGGKGVVFGRNIWQHARPAAMVRALRAVIHEGAGGADAEPLLHG